MKAHRQMRITSLFIVPALVVAGAVVWMAPDARTASACRSENSAVARLKTAEGESAGRVLFGVHGSCKTKVAARLNGLTEGFHGLHIHTTGTCDPNAQDGSSAASPFFSAGGHWNPSGADHGAHVGDMPPVLGMKTGQASLRFLSDRFKVRALFDGDGSAVIVHGGADNLANIPAQSSAGGERYHSHLYDTFGPDEDSRKTGDAGARFACGVVERTGG